MTQAALFSDIPITDAPVESDREERMHLLARVSDRVDGLIPVAVAREMLGLSKARLYQLFEDNHLEQVNCLGVSFVSGRSMRVWQEQQKHRGGRGHKNVGFWRQVVIGAKLADTWESAVSGDPKFLKD